MFVVQPFDKYESRSVHPVLFQERAQAEAFVERMRAVNAEERAMPDDTPDSVWEAWHAAHQDEPYDAYGFSIVALDVEPVVL